MGIIGKELEVAGDRGRLTAEAIFDSGSSESLVRKDIAEEVSTVFATRGGRRFTFGDGQAGFTTKRVAILDIVVNGETLTGMFWLAPKLPEDVIIGADFLQRYKIKLDPEKEAIILDPWALKNWLI